MRNSSKTSSKSTNRGPYQPVTQLLEVPIGLYEILDLAIQGEAARIVPLVRSMIETIQADESSLVLLQDELARLRGEPEGIQEAKVAAFS